MRNIIRLFIPILILLFGLSVQPAGAEEIIVFAARYYKLKGVSHFEMRQINPDGTGEKPFAWIEKVPFYAMISADGQKYVYSSAWMNIIPVFYQEEKAFLNGADPNDPALWMIDADGKNKRKLLDAAPTDLRWANDKLIIADSSPYLLNLQSGAKEPIGQDALLSHLNTLGKDFKALLYRPPIQNLLAEKAAYIRTVKGEYESHDTLEISDIRDKTIKSLPEPCKEDDRLINHIEWSPQGDKLLIERYDGLSGGPHSTLIIYDLAANQCHIVEQEISSNTAQWSPDGRRIIFQTSPDTRPIGKKQVWSTDIGIVNADGTGIKYLTSGAVYACLPRWITINKSK